MLLIMRKSDWRQVRRGDKQHIKVKLSMLAGHEGQYGSQGSHIFQTLNS
jgi:hypothetical protein